MFKMGCSKAKKILALDGGAGKSQQSADQASKKGQKPDKQQQAGFSKRATGEELNDFSKLQEDPRIPLNVRQIFKITKSWKAIARTMSKTGTAMFLNLFEQNQDLFYLFDRFQHLKGDQLHESMELREHAATVMSTLDQSINSLSDYDNFVTYLHSIGELHRKVPGFRREYFWKIEQPFLKAVKQTLDERCNETIEEIYKIAIKLIIETIAEGYGHDSGPQDDSGRSNDKSASNGDGSDPGTGGGGGNHQFQQSTTSSSSSGPAAPIGQTSATGDNLKSSQATTRARKQVDASAAFATERSEHNLECRAALGRLEDQAEGASTGKQCGIKLASSQPLRAHSASASASASSSASCSSSASARPSSSTSAPVSRVTAGRCMMRSTEEGAANMGAASRQPGAHQAAADEGRVPAADSRTATQLKKSLFVLRQLLAGPEGPITVAKRSGWPRKSGGPARAGPGDDGAGGRRQRRRPGANEDKPENELAPGTAEEPQRVGAPSGRLINCPARYGDASGAYGKLASQPAPPQSQHQPTATGAPRGAREDSARTSGPCRCFPAAGSKTWRAPLDTSQQQEATIKRPCNANERRPARHDDDRGALGKLVWASSSQPDEQLSGSPGSLPGAGPLAGDDSAAQMGQVGAEPTRSGSREQHSRLAGACRAADDRPMCGCLGIRTQQREPDGAHLSGTREAGSRRRRHCWPQPPPTRIKQSSRGHSILMSPQRLARAHRMPAAAAAAMEQKQQHQPKELSAPLRTYRKSSCTGSRAIGVDLSDVSELIKALMQALSVAQRDSRAPLPVA